jgi:predicted kinase
MQVVLFVGLQAAGKTTFYHQRFAATHLRISLDQLKTRSRELAAVLSAIQEGRSFVVDNTNATAEQRRKFIELAKPAGYTVHGYFFEPDIQGSLRRNAQRLGKQRVPVPGLFGTRKRLQVPSFAEGFDALFLVQVNDAGGFDVHPFTPP